MYDAMAVASAGLTLPAVVEELLSEMAAAVQENARSTGRRACVAALWAVDLARPGGEARGGVLRSLRAAGLGPRPRAPLPGASVLYPVRFHSQDPIRKK